MSEDGLMILDSARKLPDAGIAFEQLLISIHARYHREIRQEWWSDLVRKLEKRPVNAFDAKSLHAMNVCFIDKVCVEGVDFLKQAYAAAMSHGSPTPQLLNVHAEFAWHVLGDKEMGERDIRAAVLASPGDFNARRNLVVLLLATDQLDDAETELAVLRTQNQFGFFDQLIGALEIALLEKRNTSKMSSSSNPAEDTSEDATRTPHPGSKEGPASGQEIAQ